MRIDRAMSFNGSATLLHEERDTRGQLYALKRQVAQLKNQRNSLECDLKKQQAKVLKLKKAHREEKKALKAKLRRMKDNYMISKQILSDTINVKLEYENVILKVM